MTVIYVLVALKVIGLIALIFSVAIGEKKQEEQEMHEFDEFYSALLKVGVSVEQAVAGMIVIKAALTQMGEVSSAYLSKTQKEEVVSND